MSESWDIPQKPKGSCDACGELVRWVMGDRGPVKTPLVMTRVGHFKFCDDCLARSQSSTETRGGVEMDVLRIGSESWITGAR